MSTTPAVRVAATAGALAVVAGLAAAAHADGAPSDPADTTGTAVATAALDRPADPLTQGEIEADAVRAAQAAQAAQQTQLARERAAQERAAAAAARASRDAQRDPRSAARVLLAQHGWGGDQFGCLDQLWSKESGWKHTARNPSSGAFGIPQALPAGKLATAGADWQTNPVTQIRWGLGYIEDSYGSPCAAWAHSRSTNWY